MPGGVQNFVEAVVEAFYDMVVGIAGEENGRRFFPVVATIFFFVLIANWMSLTPIFNVDRLVGHELRRTATKGLRSVIMNKTKIGPIHLHTVPFSSPSNLASAPIRAAIRTTPRRPRRSTIRPSTTASSSAN